MCHWHIYLSPQPPELNLAKPNHVLAAGVGKTLPRDALRALLSYDFADAILSHRLLLQLTPRLAFGLFRRGPSRVDSQDQFGIPKIAFRVLQDEREIGVT